MQIKNNIKNKKAIIVGELFIYILALIVLSLIVFAGFKWINFISEKNKEAQFILFIGDLDKEIKKIHSQFGSVKVFNERNSFSSSGFKRICFVDTDPSVLAQFSSPSFSPGLCDNTHVDYNFEMCEAWKLNTASLTQNVFTLPSAKGDILIQTKFLVDGNNDTKEDIVGSCNNANKTCYYLCINEKNNRFDFKIEGKGKYALIRR